LYLVSSPTTAKVGTPCVSRPSLQSTELYPLLSLISSPQPPIQGEWVITEHPTSPALHKPTYCVYAT
ncbi:hypothetical protein J6590_104967, partial [Homalodisca vitripennis]